MISFKQFLSETIEDLTIYMRGRCAIFALALHLEKGYPLGILWDLNSEGERDYMPMGDIDHDAYHKYADEWKKEHGDDWFDDEFAAVGHVFCYKTPTVLVDIMGHTDENKMLKYYGHSWESDDFEAHFDDATREEIEKLMKPASPSNPHGGMLAPRPGEIEELRQYIRANSSKY